jgi:hypothetical protein
VDSLGGASGRSSLIAVMAAFFMLKRQSQMTASAGNFKRGAVCLLDVDKPHFGSHRAERRKVCRNRELNAANTL